MPRGVPEVAVVCVQERLLDAVRAVIPEGRVGRAWLLPGRRGYGERGLAVEGVGGAVACGELEVVESGNDEEGGEGGADVTSGALATGRRGEEVHGEGKQAKAN